MAAGEPVISVDTKKKELVGDFKNAGRAWRPQGQPEEVRVHDFLIKELGRAVPYGIYDLASNAGWVSVGMNNDTAAFAVQTIRRWWQEVGRRRYPLATRLTITADGGGSNGSRLRLWKRELQRLAFELGIDIVVHHLPPGTSKWNKIEHRLFSFITMNWKATPLVSYRVIVDLIGATQTKTGLAVHCELDSTEYPKGIVVSDQDMDNLHITHDEFHGEWNYTIHPSARPSTTSPPTKAVNPASISSLRIRPRPRMGATPRACIRYGWRYAACEQPSRCYAASWLRRRWRLSAPKRNQKASGLRRHGERRLRTQRDRADDFIVPQQLLH